MESIKSTFLAMKPQQQKEKQKMTTRQMVGMAMLTAISIVFVSVIHFPLFPAAAFLEYDPADIPILIWYICLWTYCRIYINNRCFINTRFYSKCR